MKFIYICSLVKDKHKPRLWKRFKDFEFFSLKEAQDKLAGMNQYIQKCGMWDSHEFELVGEDYFNEFKQPYL